MDMVNKETARVLVVDDEPNITELVAMALRYEGFTVQTYADGESALKSIAQRQPDLVLLDLMMPRVDGYEVCRRLRADPATRDLPVIFLSALSEAQNKATGFEAGGTDRNWARRIHGALLQAGLTGVHTVIHATAWTGGGPGARLIRATIGQLWDRLQAAGLGHDELIHISELLDDPALVLAGHPLYSTSGRRAPRAAGKQFHVAASRRG